jgi:hypothetical protein
MGARREIERIRTRIFFTTTSFSLAVSNYRTPRMFDQENLGQTLVTTG